MARSNRVELSTRSFASQSEATLFFREMLGRYKLGDRVTDEDARDLAPLLERHLEREEKLGSGIDHFEVGWSEKRTRCFWIIRTDGTRDHFSYRRCIEGV
jgi:Protein of unknown function (DUF3223)